MAKRQKPPKKGRKKGEPQRRYDWAKIRIAREVEGKSFADLSKEFGPQPETVSRHAKKDGWRDPSEVAAESSAAAAEELSRQFVVQNSAAVLKNRIAHAGVTAQIIEYTRQKMAAFFDEKGDIKAAEPLETQVLDVRRIALIVNTIERTDSNLAGISEESSSGGWRSGAGAGEGTTESNSDRVRRAMGKRRAV